MLEYADKINFLSSEDRAIKSVPIKNPGLCVSVLDFGAVGDGVTDDTQAFQNAINSGYNVYVPLAYGFKYLITATLTLAKDRQCIMGDEFVTHYFMDYRGNADEFGNIERGCLFFRPSNTTDTLFLATGQFQTFVNLCVVRDQSNLAGDDPVANICIKFDKDTSNGTSITNVDGEVRNCMFRHFDHTVELYGRGLWYTDCYCIHNNIDLYIDFKSDNEWQASPSSSSMLQTFPANVGRGIRFQNNRIHTSLEFTIRVASESVSGDTEGWGSNVLNGAIISNNQIDLGRGGFLFSADMYGCSVVDNVFYRLSSNGITINGKTKDCVFKGNIIRGIVSTVYPAMDFRPLYGFYISGDLDDCVISENVIQHTAGTGILSTGNTITRCLISGNRLDSYGENSTLASFQRSGIVIENMSMSQIIGNSFNPANAPGNFAIRPVNTSTDVWTDSFIKSNSAYVAGLTPFSPPTTSGTARNDFQSWNQ